MKQKQRFNLINSVREFFTLTPFMPIIQWIEKNISLVDDVSSQRDRPDFSLYPYQLEVLKQWEDLDVRKTVVVMACEQLRKIDNVDLRVIISFCL